MTAWFTIITNFHFRLYSDAPCLYDVFTCIYVPITSHLPSWFWGCWSTFQHAAYGKHGYERDDPQRLLEVFRFSGPCSFAWLRSDQKNCVGVEDTYTANAPGDPGRFAVAKVDGLVTMTVPCCARNAPTKLFTCKKGNLNNQKWEGKPENVCSMSLGHWWSFRAMALEPTNVRHEWLRGRLAIVGLVIGWPNHHPVPIAENSVPRDAWWYGIQHDPTTVRWGEPHAIHHLGMVYTCTIHKIMVMTSDGLLNISFTTKGNLHRTPQNHPNWGSSSKMGRLLVEQICGGAGLLPNWPWKKMKEGSVCREPMSPFSGPQGSAVLSSRLKPQWFFQRPRRKSNDMFLGGRGICQIMIVNGLKGNFRGNQRLSHVFAPWSG